MEKEFVRNKEDFIYYVLEQLHVKVYPVQFGTFFMEVAPSGGIDSFRNLLEELSENGLVIKQENLGEPVAMLPYLRTVDLRYGISLRGIQFLKDNQSIQVKNKVMKEVFVTYSWDNEEHNDKVIAFTNELRDQGFEAEMDRLYSQKESAADFSKMMHQAMTDYKKVIVVLSKGYRDKAENFKGGVGNEYNLILKDIEAQRRKYILVTFDGIHDQYIPLSFKGREIIDLSDRKNLNVLFAKLMDEDLVQFSEVGKTKPVIDKKIITSFGVDKEENLMIGNLRSNSGNASQFGQLYTMIEFDLTLELINKTKATFSDYTVEIAYPTHSTAYDTNGRVDDGFKIITHDQNPKLFPGQTRSVKLETITLRHYNAEELLKASIQVSLYTDKGEVTKEFRLKEILYVRTIYGDQPLSIELFQNRNYR